jgi:hypothetical protein
MTGPNSIAEVLRSAKTIAVVGLSDNPLRPSYGVAAYLQSHGYRVIPVNPKAQEVLGVPSYPSLGAIPAEQIVDIVDIFRLPEHVPEIVDQAIKRGVKTVWMQEDIIHEQAAEKARQAGIFVVMDQCILRAHLALGAS